MIGFPNAKINLGLHILEKRLDGFHNIESIFYPVGWADVLEVVESGKDMYTYSGLKIDGDSSNNLVVKALDGLRAEGYLENQNVHILLRKILPMGAGIGGGSADAAFVLRLLNENFSLNIENPKLEEIATKIGSDCPFFIQNRPVLCIEKGTVFKQVSISLKGYTIALVYPNIHVSTKEAYSGVVPRKRDVAVSEIIKMPIENWTGQLINDFEGHILDKYPKIKGVKEKLYKLGAIYASMTGSGSTVFGILKEPIQDLSFEFEDSVCWQGPAEY
ncbi:MAG: 4-(cytidine 5'-diphospho)-2-C-methyl-D-erythritol kinase [Leadbetterella sp.]